MAIQARSNRNNTTSYLVRVRDTRGKFYPVRSFSRKIDAKDHEAKLLTERTKGSRAECVFESKLLLDEYFAKWRIECRSKVSEGWKKSQDQMYRDHISPILGSFRINTVRPKDIQAVLTAAQIKGLGTSVQKHLYVLMHSVFKAMVEHSEVLALSPVRTTMRPKQNLVTRNFLKAEESLALLKLVEGTWMEWPTTLALLCGLRIGEVQGLRWESVDLVNNRIVIRSSFNRRISKLQDHPKQGDWGQVPIPALCEQKLRALSIGKDPRGYVATGKDGESMLDYQSYAKALKALCTAHQLPPLTCHELRHSSSELWYSYGASAEDIRRLLNHKSVSTTQRYIHRTDERLNRIASQVGIISEVNSTLTREAPTKEMRINAISAEILKSLKPRKEEAF